VRSVLLLVSFGISLDQELELVSMPDKKFKILLTKHPCLEKSFSRWYKVQTDGHLLGVRDVRYNAVKVR